MSTNLPVLRRRTLRYSLRTLLAAITVFAVWFGYVSNRAIQQRNAVEVVRKYGGQVQYLHEGWGRNGWQGTKEHWSPAWLRKLLGDDYFLTVSGVILELKKHSGELTDEEFASLASLSQLRSLNLTGPDLTADRLRLLRKFPRLEELELSNTGFTEANIEQLACPQLKRLLIQHFDFTEQPDLTRLAGSLDITDRGIEQLARQFNLEQLELTGARITDASMERLAAMSSLKELNLDCAPISDAGLAPLAKLPNLERLSLNRANVTDAGMPMLASLPALTILQLGQTAVTDAGVELLRPLVGLRHLILADTAVTGATLGSFSELQSLHLVGTRVTDKQLPVIGSLPKLSTLFLNSTSITDAGLSALLSSSRVDTLFLNNTYITDAALVPLKTSTVRQLFVFHTKFSEAAADQLRAATGTRVYTGARPQ